MKIKLKILDKTIQAEGKTLPEALNKLKFEGFAGLKSFLTVGDRTIFLPAQKTRRLFSGNPLIKEVAIKQIAMLFT